MGKKKSKQKDNSSSIVVNRAANHEYFISDRYEAGLVLQGWEVKSLREKRVQIKDSYVQIKNGEAWLHACIITPLPTVSTHYVPEERRMRKLLLNRVEIDRLSGAVDRKGMTLVALNMHWSKGRAKLEIGLGKGKKDHDKRATEKDRDWKREQARVMKRG